MRSSRLLIPVLAMTLLGSAGNAFAQQYYDPPPVEHWQDSPEREFEHRGLQDGLVGADRDFQNHRRPDVNNRDEYRDPRNLPGWARHEYREGFRRGYYQRVRQIYGDRPGDGYR